MVSGAAADSPQEKFKGALEPALPGQSRSAPSGGQRALASVGAHVYFQAAHLVSAFVVHAASPLIVSTTL